MILVMIIVATILLVLMGIRIQSSKFNRIDYYEGKLKKYSGTHKGDYFEKKLRELER